MQYLRKKLEGVNMLKMVMLVYNEALESEVMDVLKNCGLESFTKIPGVFGKGSSSGAHFGNDIWPGRNNILFVASDEEKCKKLIFYIRELRRKLKKEGIKAFVWNLEETT
jgi:nitrogen regulatory protein PII